MSPVYDIFTSRLVPVKRKDANAGDRWQYVAEVFLNPLGTIWCDAKCLVRYCHQEFEMSLSGEFPDSEKTPDIRVMVFFEDSRPVKVTV